ncbi:hypothetical protein [Nevskia sp.]|uniref:hypothetical protein n=1 Tax=Nevskia sp. TaxID=1929292 RepID=UPI003F6F2945
MSNRTKSDFRRQQRADLGRLVMIGLTAAVMVGAARAVTAQEAPAAPAPAPGPATSPAPTPTPPAGGTRPSVDVSADAAVDFPGDI